MLTVEIKSYSPMSGLEIVHYIELQNDGSGDGEVGNYLVCHYAREGLQRALIGSSAIKGHPRHLGAVALVRRALNQFVVEQATQVEESVVA